MNIKLEEGRLSFDIVELFERLTLEEKKVVAQTLACQDDIVEYVAQQLIQGCTDDGWHASTGPAHNPFTALDNARLRVAAAAPAVAAQELAGLQRAAQHFYEQWNKLLFENARLKSRISDLEYERRS